jgi:hypothetical protein
MALKIQLRRDIAANWTTNNPLLLNGEIGIETDTLKFKIGNGTQRWNSLSSYALKPGEPNGVATLDSSGKLPLSQLPDQISLDAEAAAALQNAMSSISTTNIAEGTNLYFTGTRARSAVEGLYDQIGSAAQALSSANSHTGVKFQDAITAAASDATVKSNSAVTLAGQNADQKINTAILSLSTSVIPEGINLYFTNQRVSDIVTPLINNTRTYIDESLANFEAPSAITSTSQLREGSNLYFTNARAVTATNAARTASLNAALSAVDDLRTELRTDIDSKIPYSDRNTPGGVVGLDLNSKIQDSIIPSTIARTSDITSAIADIVNLAPDSLNTLGELAAAFQADQNQNGLAALITTVGTKLDSSIAATIYAPIDSPTFTGTPVIPGYATSINLAAALTEAKAYTDTAKNSIDNSLGGYQPEAEKNQAGGYAGLDSSSKILESVIPESITTSIASATDKANTNINGTYTNGSSSSNINKITYGTDLTPPSSGNSAGDIYIQY